MNAAGTKILFVRAKKTTDRNGVVIPDSAQPNAAYGLVLSVGPQCSEELRNQVAYEPTVILFNPLQTVDSAFEDKAGRLAIECVDQDGIFGTLSLAEAQEWFGTEFPTVPEDCPLSVQ